MMNPENTSLLKVGDFLLIIIIILATVLLTYRTVVGKTDSNSKLRAVIIKDTHIEKIINLKQKDLNTIIELNDKYNIKISGQYGKIRFSHATCPDKLCIAAGWLTAQGDTAICMPARTIVKIERIDSQVDSVAY